MVEYNAGATLMMLEDPGPNGIQNGVMIRGGPVWTGTLAGAIRRAMTLKPEDQWRVSIAVGHEAGTPKKLLRFGDIEALAQSQDFPTRVSGASERRQAHTSH
jgi:hypothetical protein